MNPALRPELNASAAPISTDGTEAAASHADGLGNAGDQATAGPPLPAPPGTGCPPPLAWQDVLREFIGAADAWYLDRPQYRLSGRTWGQGPPLYFLNGMGGSHELFCLLAYLLHHDYRCVLFDYPGTHRDDGASLAQVTLTDLEDDLLAIADQLGDDRLNLFATSFGCLVALGVMLRRPERIERAILQGGFAHLQLSAAERVLLRVFRWHPGRMWQVPLRRLIQQANHRPWFPPFDQTRWQFFSENSGGVPVRAVAHRAAIIRNADLRPRLPEVAPPVLVIRSEGEAVVAESSHDDLARGLPGARVEFMPATGHIPYLTHPHRLAKLIREFAPSETAHAPRPS